MRSVYTNPTRDPRPKLRWARRIVKMGVSVPVADANFWSTAESRPMSVPKVVPVSLTAATGWTMRRVRLERAVEDEVVRDPPADVAAQLGVAQVVPIAARGGHTARFPRRLRIQVHDETTI